MKVIVVTHSGYDYTSIYGVFNSSTFDQDEFLKTIREHYSDEYANHLDFEELEVIN